MTCVKYKHRGALKTLLHMGYHVYSTAWEAAIGEEWHVKGSTTTHDIVMPQLLEGIKLASDILAFHCTQLYSIVLTLLIVFNLLVCQSDHFRHRCVTASACIH